ncbi:hypothetical protein ACFE04_017848 [Oxalis oulophora]
MEQMQQRTSVDEAYFNSSRTAINDLFNLYLGQKLSQTTYDDSRNKAQKRVDAVNRKLDPPPNEQFLLDFKEIQSQFQDQDQQLRFATQSVLVAQVVQCSGHAPRAEFILFALRSLSSIGYINWDTFLSSLLSWASNSEMSLGQRSLPCPGISPSSNLVSPLASVHSIASPDESSIESPSMTSVNEFNRDNAISSLHQLCCKIIVTGLEFNLKPRTHADVFHHMLNWLVNWDQTQQSSDRLKSQKHSKAFIKWLHSCLDVILRLVEKSKSRVPFYELIRSDMQFIENIPDDEALFTLILEIHRRRDMMATYMQMLDQHLHCPTFGTAPFLSQTARIMGLLKELASSIQKESLDWERALRCLRHALRTTSSPGWWVRSHYVAHYNRTHHHAFSFGDVFTSAMICEALIDRIIELLMLTNSEINCWQDWLIFSDIFYFLVGRGIIDFVEFVDNLVSRLAEGDCILQTNHVTWLLAQIIQTELVMKVLSTNPRKVEITRKILSVHKENRSSDLNSPQSILLDFVSSCLSLHNLSLDTSYIDVQLKKGKQIDEWWKQVSKVVVTGSGDGVMDYMNMDERSAGMFWAFSFNMTQLPCEAIMSALSSAGTEFLAGPVLQHTEKLLLVTKEVNPIPMSLLSGFSLHLCSKLINQMEESLFGGQVVPSIAMVETYCRLLLLAPHSLFHSLFPHLDRRTPHRLRNHGSMTLVFEILNYRLLPLCRYGGKTKQLMHDIIKIISFIKGKRGEHRLFRLAENFCMNQLLSLRNTFFVTIEGKGPAEYTETLNRITIITLAIIIKTRGIVRSDNLLCLPTLLEEILANSQHTWSEKTLRHFPASLYKALIVRAETTVLSQCTKLFSPSADPTCVTNYISHSSPQHWQYLCAGAWWILMEGHPENMNSENLAHVLRVFSPEEVTANIYTMVDVLLHHIRIELQGGHSSQDLLLKACENLSYFIWTQELLPLDILLLALIDRDDDPHALPIVISLLDRKELLERVKLYCDDRGSSEHWLYSGVFKRAELQKALGNHLSWKQSFSMIDILQYKYDRYPTFFDDVAARLLPVIPLIVFRLIKNDAFEQAERILGVYTPLLAYHPFRFTFFHDILAYFYGHLPGKLILRILNVLDISKIPLTESFRQHINSSNTGISPPLDYFATLLMNLVNKVIPPLKTNYKSGPTAPSDDPKPFYQIQDPGTYTQLILETTVIELLSLPLSPSQIVLSLVKIVASIQSTLNQSRSSPNSAGLGSVLPTATPGGGNTDNSSDANRSIPSVSGINSSVFASRSGYTFQQLSCLLIQACGLLLAQLPISFHSSIYSEVARVIKESLWLTDGIDSAASNALVDPAWAAQDITSTAIGNIIALLHTFFNELPQEWLMESLIIISHLRPISSIAKLRITFRVLGPLLPRLANVRLFFKKMLLELFSALEDVFGINSQATAPAEASEIVDIIDFIHHAVHYEGQGGPVQHNSKPHPEVLAICAEAAERLRPDVRRLFSHLNPDVNSSIYVVTH